MSAPLPYHSPSTPNPAGRRQVSLAAAVAAGVILLANGVLLALAYADRSWGALGIAFMIGPITNAVLAIAALACVRIVKRRSAGAPTTTYLLVSLLLPVLAIAADFFAIWSMGLRGS